MPLTAARTPSLATRSLRPLLPCCGVDVEARRSCSRHRLVLPDALRLVQLFVLFPSVPVKDESPRDPGSLAAIWWAELENAGTKLSERMGWARGEEERRREESEMLTAVHPSYLFPRGEEHK